MFHYGGVCFIMVGYVSCGVFHAVFHYGGVCFIMVGYVSCGILCTNDKFIFHYMKYKIIESIPQTYDKPQS